MKRAHGSGYPWMNRLVVVRIFIDFQAPLESAVGRVKVTKKSEDTRNVSVCVSVDICSIYVCMRGVSSYDRCLLTL